jgi:hypothetical protein
MAADPLANWTGAGIGEGVTTSPLYAREQPEINARAVALWQMAETLLIWAEFGGWYMVSSLLRRAEPVGWSSAAYIRRTL